ncbi:MAG TPA: arylamine N-acetyltransferase [Natrialbaceae archaeon]|nr:arylamine N-acetyltransferase [Natrialbaceae archaeon]
MSRDSSVAPRTSGGDDGRVEPSGERPGRLSPEDYLGRIGVAPETVETADLATLGRLQRAHVRAVPFETLAITGDPYSDRSGSGVTLSLPAIYEKVVDRGRGGYCFELNGLFHWLLAELGYDVDRVAARVTSDGDAGPPANHHTNVVELDRRYVVDVGMGSPVMRRPVPLDGGICTDEADVKWRIVESDRPDETYRSEFREPGDEEWTQRFVFSDVSRDLQYFEATNDYLQSAPESPFTGDPVVSIATEDGHLKLSGDTLTETTGAEEHEHTVPSDEWHATLEAAFGLHYGRG